tara:strand:+ start:1675 stop:2322 length:648 start_codon:yes stop_codon:yes gene_type:complete
MDIINQLEKEIKELFHKENSGHDLHHLKRVLNLALTLQEKEGGDKIVIGVAAFLHDLHRVIGNGKYCSPKESLPKVKEILDKVELSEVQKERILHCIEFHEEYNFTEEGKTVHDKETLIVQDADNLEALGAIGIARAFMFAGAKKVPMWIPELPFNREKFDDAVLDPSEIHHFYSKLLKLKENMNTETAKKMATERTTFMELFLKEFFAEWKGKK